MRRMMILAGALLAGCQTTPAIPQRSTPQTAASVDRLTWPYRASYEATMMNGAAQDRRIRIAVTCGHRPQAWGDRAYEIVGMSMGRALSAAQMPPAEEARLRVIGSAMRAQAYSLGGAETENNLPACAAFMARYELDALRGYLMAADPSFPG